MKLKNKKIGKNVKREYETNKYVYNFLQYETMRSFTKNRYWITDGAPH